ncbi:MAG TPA: leucyl aminopeptidase family protein [Chromatiales bacterium]|nr:leucyl aminopeptidase family protein [Thiotrichales bacterium]HIP67997.1 leucyl aminopeptidase family protein [Chromatiales bacterium]
MLDCFTTDTSKNILLRPVSSANLDAWLSQQPDAIKSWVELNHFKAKADSFCLLSAEGKQEVSMLYGINDAPDIWSLAAAPGKLPPGNYRLDMDWSDGQLRDVMLGWALGSYAFTRYKKPENDKAKLVVNEVDKLLSAQINAIYRVRNLINTPPDDMMPPQLSDNARELAKKYDAKFKDIIGNELLKQNYPAIHAVGRASVHAPRLLEIKWGDSSYPRVALIGKGVCFDSGGLDIKPARGMRLMQKDMGGAAHVLGLAEMIMAAELPVYLQVLIPAVENAISGSAFHPGDIIKMRNDKTVEIDNTDAEGRLVLADAMVAACEQNPQLVIDFATLTGAARVAVGTEIGAMFSNNAGMAADVLLQAEAVNDPLWQLPLHKPYHAELKSQFADLLNCSTSGYGGAITAALFLQEFIGEKIDWLHFDVMAWNTRNRPGRPKGGEAMGVRAIFEWLKKKYGRDADASS